MKRNVNLRFIPGKAVIGMRVTLKELTFGYETAHPIFKDLSCTFPAGSLVALLGPSGSGKSTLLNLLAGLLTPASGHLYFGETDVTRRDGRQRNIGMVFQDHALYPHLTVLDNIAFPLKMAHVKKAERLTQARQLARLVHVDDQLAKFPGALSGGQQQRVAIARALIKQPDLLLLDEPLSNLDAALRQELRDEIRRIQRETGVTTVVVTHDQADALHIADQIIVLADGQIQQTGTGTDLYAHPQNQFVARFIGTPPINLLPVTALPAAFQTALPTTQPAITTLGLRSESLSLATTAVPTATDLPVTVTRQERLGRETLTTLTYQQKSLISTAITTPVVSGQALRLTVTPAGCCGFDATEICQWTGDAHA